MVGVIAASLVAVATVSWPYRLGLLAAIVCGIGAAVAAEKALNKQGAAG